MRFTKSHLLERLEQQERSYRLAILASHWLRGGSQYKPSAIEDARSLSMEAEGKWIPYADLADLLEHGIVTVGITSDFILNQLHALIRAPFELIRAYCKDYDRSVGSQQLTQELRHTDWYEFTRLIRNAISHSFWFEFKEYDKKLLPITWGGITLTADMDGTPMKYELWHKPGYTLFLTMQRFAAALPELSISSSDQR
jgi:hypothetical protein